MYCARLNMLENFNTGILNCEQESTIQLLNYLHTVRTVRLTPKSIKNVTIVTFFGRQPGTPQSQVLSYVHGMFLDQ